MTILIIIEKLQKKDENTTSPYSQDSSEMTPDPFSKNLGCGFFLLIFSTLLIALSLGILFYISEYGVAPMFFLATSALLFAAFTGLWKFKIELRKLFGPLQAVKENSHQILLTIPLIFCSMGFVFLILLLSYWIYPSTLDSTIGQLSGFEFEFESLNSRIFMFLAVVIIGPVAEEILFRGVLFTRWARIYSPAKAAFYSSLLFGVLHANAIGLFFVGWMLCMIYMYTKSLWIPVIIHIFNNLIAVLLSHYQILNMGEVQSEWISHNSHQLIIWVIATFVIIFLLYKKYSPAVYRQLPYDYN